MTFDRFAIMVTSARQLAAAMRAEAPQGDAWLAGKLATLAALAVEIERHLVVRAGRRAGR